MERLAGVLMMVKLLDTIVGVELQLSRLRHQAALQPTEKIQLLN